MRSVSDRFKEAITQSHQMVVRANVLHSTGETAIDVLDGSVTLDVTADTRGALTLAVPHDLAPQDSSDLLTPYGNEIQVFRGISYPDDTEELVSLGIYRIEDMSDNGSEVAISGLDRSARVIDGLFEATVNVSEFYGANVVDAIRNMILEVYPECQFRFGTTSAGVPTDRSAIEGNSRWEACQVLAELIGCVIYFDNDGYCLLRPVPLATQVPVATVSEGESLTDATREWSRTDSKNRWVVTGETDDDPPVSLRGEATDDDSASPTRYGGPFGKVPDYYTNEWITESDDQAGHVAAIRKALLAGISQTVPFTSLVNPALEPLDVVRVVRSEAGVDHNVILDALTIPLGVEGTMTATTRAAQI